MALCASPACTDRRTGDDGEVADGGVDGGEVEPPLEWHTLFRTENDDLDVLFVLDDTVSMAEKQATLAANLESFIDVLERPELHLNYRIGITTTDDGNPWCVSTPEAGALQLRSCRSHLEDFVYEGVETVDVSEEACTALCPAEWAEIETLPTTTARDDTPRPRSWIERTAGVANLPEGLSTAQALQCLAPQGIAGCQFESPLESMWKALERTDDADDPNFDFIRELALLMVVIVTDEDDCSYNPDWDSIFMPDGNRVFWSDQDASAPTSAVCWNAGVACTGSGTYDECHAVDLDVNGNPVAEEHADDLAVLRPVSRYVELLQEIEDRKQALLPSEVVVSVIGGVRPDGSVTYADAVNDPTFQQDFGIGPGCEGESGRAVPPVRLRGLAEAFSLGNQSLFSVCGRDYTNALEPVAETLLPHALVCMPICVADTDPSTPDVLDPSCELVLDPPDVAGAPETAEIPPCGPGNALPVGQDVCHVQLAGDDRDEYCADSGFNLQFQLVWRDHVYVAPGTEILARCEPSRDAAIDCPDLS